MKKVLFVLAAIGAAWFFILQRPKAREIKASMGTPAAKSNAPGPRKDSMLANADSSLRISGNDASVAPECVKFWHTVSRWDIAQLMKYDEPSMVQAPYPRLVTALSRMKGETSCSGIGATHPLHKVHQTFLSACAPEKLTFPYAEITPDRMPLFAERHRQSVVCLDILRAYRLQMVRHLNRATPLSEITDTSTLFAIAFAESEAADMDPGVIEAISRRILELDPSNALAADVLVRSAYNAWRLGGHNTGAEQDLDQAVHRLSALAPDRVLLRELSLARAKESGDVTQLKRLASEEVSRNPRSEMGMYYLAWASYLEGDIEKCRQHLVQLTKEQPESVRAQFTLNLIAKDDLAQGQPPFVDEPGVVLPSSVTPSHYQGLTP